MSGFGIPGDQSKIDAQNADLPRRKAANEAWKAAIVPLRHAAQAAGQKAAGYFVPGFGVTKPDLWKAAAKAARAVAEKAEEGQRTNAFSIHPPDTLEFIHSRNDAKGEAATYTKWADEYEANAAKAADNEAKIAAKKLADDAAAAKKAKNDASTAKRRATLAAKKADPALKKWAGSS